jgi:uncharacterized membrane protein YdjX (TVP38/TMEM64 family)
MGLRTDRMKNLWIRIAVRLVLVALALGLVYFAFVTAMPELLPLLAHGDEAEVQAYLQKTDHFSGLLCTALLQAMQVFSVVLPGPPIQIAAGIVYGTWRAFFVCHLSSVAANLLVFLLARRLNTRMDRLIPVNRRTSKLDFLIRSDRPAYMTVVAYLIPVLPNGIIPYAAAKTNIKFLPFVLSCYFGSLFSVLVLCAAGSKITSGGYVFAGILVVVLFVLVFLLSKHYKRILPWIDKARAKLSHGRE